MLTEAWSLEIFAINLRAALRDSWVQHKHGASFSPYNFILDKANLHTGFAAAGMYKSGLKTVCGLSCCPGE